MICKYISNSSKIQVLWSFYLFEYLLKKPTVSISERSRQIRGVFSNTRELFKNMLEDLNELASYMYVFGKLNLC